MQEIRTARFEVRSAHYFLMAFVASCAVAAALIGSFPIGASIATIFLFAGVHNVMEFRYFIARMPMRWGRSRLYYSVGIGGVVVLSAAYLILIDVVTDRGVGVGFGVFSGDAISAKALDAITNIRAVKLKIRFICLSP